MGDRHFVTSLYSGPNEWVCFRGVEQMLVDAVIGPERFAPADVMASVLISRLNVQQINTHAVLFFLVGHPPTDHG
jgi:hypothetical protein